MTVVARQTFDVRFSALLLSIEENTGIPLHSKRKLVYVFLGLVILSPFIFGIGQDICCALVEFIFPAWASFKAVEHSPCPSVRRWLSYWIIVGSLHLLETAFGVFFYFIPFWFFLKMVFLVFLQIPKYDGAQMVYDFAAAPLMKILFPHSNKKAKKSRSKLSPDDWTHVNH